MFDELLNTETDTAAEERAFEEGRTGIGSLFTMDTPNEAQARERGNEARIDAEQTRKESEDEEDDGDDDE